MEKQIIGTAYAFFDCRASTKRIEEEFSHIREAVKTPLSLELFLIENSWAIEGDRNLQALIGQMKDMNLEYLIKATDPNSTNKETAEEICAIFYQLKKSQLYQSEEKFRGFVFYENSDNGYQEIKQES